jgi:hypothetical protein
MPETLIIPCPVDALVYRNRDVLDGKLDEGGRRQRAGGRRKEVRNFGQGKSVLQG